MQNNHPIAAAPDDQHTDPNAGWQEQVAVGRAFRGCWKRAQAPHRDRETRRSHAERLGDGTSAVRASRDERAIIRSEPLTWFQDCRCERGVALEPTVTPCDIT